jgi:hypothetical protein
MIDVNNSTPNVREIAALPAWLADAIGKPRQQSGSVAEAAVDLDQSANVAWAIDFLKNDAPLAKEGAGGDATTFKVAAALRDYGISESMVVELMADHYNERCEPPWSIEGLTKKVENAFSYSSLAQPGGKTAEAEFTDDTDNDATLIPTMGDPETIAREAADRAMAKNEPEADGRPMVVFDPADLPKIVRKVQSLVIESAAKENAKPADQIFQRTGNLVHLSRNRLKPGAAMDKHYHVENDLLITAAEPGWLADRLERDILFGRIGKKKGASGQSKAHFVPMAVPPVIVTRLSAIKQDWEYPTLAGTVETPTLRSDGTVLDVPGYDRKSALYFDPGLMTFPPIKARPTKADANAALEILKKPLADFPFADEDGVTGLSRAVALAMLLTAVCRRTLPIAPMFGIDANEAQSGKTELAQVAAIVMTGRRTGVRPLSSDEYQRATALAAAFEAGDAIILYDNIDGDKMAVEGAALCMAITEERFQMRRLGGNSAEDQIIAPTNALMVATGNKLTAAGDMAEDRLLICNLRTDKPLAQRKFAHWPLDEYVISMRAALVSAALTILRAHIIAKDKKPGPNFRFAEWRSIVADALVWLGEADPVLSTIRVKADDPIRDAQADVLRVWARYLGESEQTTAGVLGHLDVQKAIAEARGVDAARLTKDAAVKYLKGMVGIELLGYKLVRSTDPHDKMLRWRLKPGANALPIKMAAPVERRAVDDCDDDDGNPWD